MSDEKDMATKESLFSLIERIESTLEDKISELEKKLEALEKVFLEHEEVKIIYTDMKKLKDRIEKLEEDSMTLRTMHNWDGELTDEDKHEYQDINLWIHFNKEISELKEFIDRVFEVSNEDGKRIEKLEQWKQKSWNMHQELAQDILPNYVEQEIAELKEQIEDNHTYINKNIIEREIHREVLRELHNIIKGSLFDIKNHDFSDSLYEHYKNRLNENLIKLLGEKLSKSKNSTHILTQCPKCKHKYLINKEDIS